MLVRPSSSIEMDCEEISRRKFIAADMEVISKGMFGSPRVGRIIRRASNVETTAANANPKIPKEASISLFK